jgi:hypothetical protein
MRPTTILLELVSFHASSSIAASLSFGKYVLDWSDCQQDKTLPGVNVAWVGGAQPCDTKVVISGAGINPYGLHFNVGWFNDMHLEECRGTL